MKKLNAQQIERLYQFTSQHYVEYYDVQTELVDHLASAIEKHWEENPDQDFEELLQKEFKKFGVFGFMDVVEERQKSMTKKYYKLMLNETKDFLSSAKVLFGALTCWAIFMIITQLSFGFILISSLCFAALLGMFVYSLVKLYQLKKEVKNKERKPYLL